MPLLTYLWIWNSRTLRVAHWRNICKRVQPLNISDWRSYGRMVTNDMRIALAHFSLYFLRSNRCFLTTMFCLAEWGSFCTPIASHHRTKRMSCVAVVRVSWWSWKWVEGGGGGGGRVGGGYVIRVTPTYVIRELILCASIWTSGHWAFSLSQCPVLFFSPLWTFHPSCSRILVTLVVPHLISFGLSSL